LNEKLLITQGSGQERVETRKMRDVHSDEVEDEQPVVRDASKDEFNGAGNESVEDKEGVVSSNFLYIRSVPHSKI
jgi:hypothetical protein